MRVPMIKWVLLGGAVAAVAGGFFALGHVTAGAGDARAHGYQQGHVDGYANGLATGETQGREEGRALQASSIVPADSRQPAQDGFTTGYAAGASDAFGNFDGGWAVSTPYALTVQRASGNSVYAITSRTLLAPGINYYLCPDGHTLCHEPRP
jgi:hypothetical protein